MVRARERVEQSALEDGAKRKLARAPPECWIVANPIARPDGVGMTEAVVGDPPPERASRRLQGGRNGVQKRGVAYAEPVGVDAATALLVRSTAGARNYRDVAFVLVQAGRCRRLPSWQRHSEDRAAARVEAVVPRPARARLDVGGSAGQRQRLHGWVEGVGAQTGGASRRSWGRRQGGVNIFHIYGSPARFQQRGDSPADL
jgi:hypothetical protein